MRRPETAILVLGGLLAVLGGAAAQVAPELAAAGALALVVVVAVVAHPPAAAYVLLATTPLIVGIDRGAVIPALRPSEAVLGLVAAGLLGRAAIDFARGRPLTWRPTRLDGALVALAVAGSVLPLAWMVARGRAIAPDDVLYGLQLWKYYAVFLVVRAAVRTEHEVLVCLWICVAGAVAVAAVGIAQVAGVGPVVHVLSTYYAPFDDASLVQNLRGSSTIAAPQAVADVMAITLAIVAGLFLRGRRRGLLLACAGVLVFGAVAAGQFSGIVALLVACLAIGVITRTLGRQFLVGAPLLLLAAIALKPVIDRRIAGLSDSGLPASWSGRLHNLQTHFWPELFSGFNWVLGVRPSPRVPLPGTPGRYVFIESGHTWLLWVGGLPLLLAFAYLTVAGLAWTTRVARARSDALGLAATASCTALAVVAVGMIFDPHITLRGTAELFFALLALALHPRLVPAREWAVRPPPGTR